TLLDPATTVKIRDAFCPLDPSMPPQPDVTQANPNPRPCATDNECGGAKCLSGDGHPGLVNRTVTKTVIVYVKAFGQTLGGRSVESGEYQWPLRVCKGCYVVFDSDCTAAPTMPLVPCFAGQDQPVSCYRCSSVVQPNVCQMTTP